MKKSTSALNRILVCALAFLVPAAVMTIGGALINIAPFGDNGFLVSDISAQFAAFFTAWRDAVCSDVDNLTYSLSKTLGGDMIGFSGYYLNNPFLFILLLFPAEKVAVGIYWMMVLMISSMGLTFELMLDNKYGVDYRHLIFAWGYALSGYSMATLTLPMYTCSLILLPIAVMGIDMMLKQTDGIILWRPALIYILSLAVLVWCNYYIGYMICIFCGLYFLTCLSGTKSSLAKIVMFAVSSLLAILAASPFLVPIVKSLSGQKTLELSVLFNSSLSYRPGALIFNLFPGQFRCDFTNAAAPCIYVGMVVLICVALFFLNRKIAIRRKLCMFIFLAILVISTWINGLDSVWHGFNQPVGFSHRQAFVIVFALLLIGAEGLEMICRKEHDSDGHFVSASVLAVLPAILLAFQLLELSYNTISSLKSYEAVEMSSQREYEEYYRKNKAIINTIKEDDQKGVYRIEKDYSRNHNDAMMLDYNGLSHNSSCEKEYVKTFMARMGLRNQGIWAAYREGSTSFTDSLLGVKYFVSRFDSTNKPYEPLFSYEGSYVYENPYALPLAWMDSMEHISGVNLKSQNLFDIQNQMAETEIYTPAKFAYEVSGLSEAKMDTDGAKYWEESTDDILGVKNSGMGTHSEVPAKYSLYERTSDNGYIQYTIDIDSECNLYCYFAAPIEQGALLYINDVLWDDYFSDYRWGIVNCGNYMSGDEVTVRLEATEDELKLYEAYFYEEHLDALEGWYNDASATEATVDKITSSHLRVQLKNVPEDDDLLVFSLPYEENWHINVDGVSVEPVMVYDALMAVPIARDSKEIEMVYKADFVL